MSDWNREAIHKTLVTRFTPDELHALIFHLELPDTSEVKLEPLALYILKLLFTRQSISLLEDWVTRNRNDIDISAWRTYSTSQPRTDDVSSRSASSSAPSLSTSLPPTIDHHDALAQFLDFMQPHSPLRVYRLIGIAQMGKTHLVAKVFPGLAQRDFGAQVVILDLRGGEYSIPELLHLLSEQLGGVSHFPSFYAARNEWIDGLEKSDPNLEEWKHRGERRLTDEFLTDLRNSGRLTLIVFDNFNGAIEHLQKWLVYTLLVRANLPHVRFVLAGHELIALSSSHANAYCECYLEPVVQPDAYLAYCKELGIAFSREQIHIIITLLDHSPGGFINALPKLKSGNVYG